MRRGRRPVPTVLKILRGNPGKRRLNQDEPQPTVMLPDPPSTIKGEALEEWNRRAPQLERLGLLTEVDVPAFIGYCKAWGRYVDAEAKIATMGDVVRAPSGYPIQNPYLAVSNKALKQCHDFWSEFGMMPSSRSRVNASRPKSATPKSRVERFMQRVK